jgi:hypothetical protein
MQNKSTFRFTYKRKVIKFSTVNNKPSRLPPGDYLNSNILQNIIMKLASTFKSTTSILRSNSPLTDDQIRRVAPSVFADTAHDSRSQRYTYLPTSEVLTSLRREGFQPFMACQGGTRVEGKADFTKHMLRLRHAASITTTGEEVPEIILINSHDGTSSYQLLAGCFRFVCCNGMVTGQQLGEVRVRHSGDIVGQVIDGCIDLVQQMPRLNDSVAQFKALTLSEPEQRAFAIAAHSTRFDAESTVRADNLLTPKRREDNGPDLWKTLNRVQENVIRGGVGYVQQSEKSGRSYRRTREVKGIDQNVGINRALWVLAEEMAKIKNA